MKFSLRETERPRSAGDGRSVPHGIAGRGGILPIAVAAFLIIPLGIWDSARMFHIISSTPPSITIVPSFNHFLSRADARTPATARIALYAYGNSGGLLFFRASYMLYPRPVFPLMNIDSFSWSGPTLSRRDLMSRARSVHATYLLVWGMSPNRQGILSVQPAAQQIVKVVP